MMNSLFDLETAFDSGLLGVEALQHWPVFGKLLRAVADGRWNQVYFEAEEIFQSSDRASKVFALQWAVSASESQYDLKRRSHWLKRWAEIRDWASDPYCQYLRTYQEGVTAIFAGSLREAEALFRRAYELAFQQEYGRGQMRSLFHLGLVFRNRSDFKTAQSFFTQALELAKQRKATVFIARIEAQFMRLGDGSTPQAGEFRLDIAKHEIEVSIRKRDFAAARKQLARAERHRRVRHLTRHRESLMIYLALVALGRGFSALWTRLAARITDPLPRIRMMELKKTAFGLDESETFELAALKEMHGVDSVIVRSSLDSDSMEVCGVTLGNIGNAHVRNLMTLLLKATAPVEKETLCKELWGLSYDPVVHDGKIYKLFHRARSYFGRNDLFVNTYGAYRLNPELLPSAPGDTRRAS
ncbi:MAG: hypothetical protein A2X94_03445 [Bdellovibrionales bacterium GWB1_55_8]|nr:MAG: hypothetical protein A2X94_03445 [Bdellovibrionales bacterium GWB1_55_8]